MTKTSTQQRIGNVNTTTQKGQAQESWPALDSTCRDYSGVYLRQLPFVKMAKDQRKAFLELNVKPVKSYGEACREGGRIAAIFMAWLKDNPTG